MATTLRFRKSLTIIPGVRLNFGKTGFTSISMGMPGVGVSYGRKGVRSHIGLPGTGLSLQNYTPYKGPVQPMWTNSNNGHGQVVLAILGFSAVIGFLIWLVS
jgi:hypothetical protein